MGKYKLIFDQKDPRCMSRTKQEFKNECNINKIIDKYTKKGLNFEQVGMLARISKEAGAKYGDFTVNNNYQQLLDTVLAVNMAFDMLPSHIRTMFNEDVLQALKFIADPNNKAKCIELGLIEKDREVIDPNAKKRAEISDAENKASMEAKNNA